MGTVLAATPSTTCSMGQTGFSGTVIGALVDVEVTFYFVVEVFYGRVKGGLEG